MSEINKLFYAVSFIIDGLCAGRAGADRGSPACESFSVRPGLREDAALCALLRIQILASQ